MNITTSYDVMKKLVRRGDDLTLPTNIDGLYNQLLFDLCADDTLIGFTLFGSYNPALDQIGFVTENINNKVVNFLTWVAPDGTAIDEPTDGVQINPCTPGDSVESGTCQYNLSGWGRLRRSSGVRDTTDVITKFCQSQPIYTIAGTRIEDDYVWDLTRISSVMLQDFQRQFIIGNKSVAGQHDGLSRVVTYGYTDANGQRCTSMDGTVIDYAENAMCPSPDAPTEDVTINGVAAPDGYQLLDYINAWLRKTAKRIRMSTLSGQYRHIGLIPTETLSCLIDCYVCFVTCGRDVSRMNEPDVRAEISRLKSDLNENRAITLNHQGINVTWYTWDYELVNSTGFSDIYILTPTVGNTPLLRIETKDMSAVASHPSMARTAQDMRVSDGSRFLSWTTVDHTCYQIHSEIQHRIWCLAPWAQLRITNISCDPIYGHISEDPLSDYYPEQNKVAMNKVPNIVPNAAFTSSVNVKTVTFTNTTVLTGVKTPVSYLWVFGDGATSTEASPVRIYATAATFSVTLVVTDGNGNSDTFTANVTTV